MRIGRRDGIGLVHEGWGTINFAHPLTPLCVAFQSGLENRRHVVAIQKRDKIGMSANVRYESATQNARQATIMLSHHL